MKTCKVQFKNAEFLKNYKMPSYTYIEDFKSIENIQKNKLQNSGELWKMRLEE